MGFDNEYILNIQSLPGEYFCPVCRTLVYPNEALQTQCTHLYCKPCLAYVAATTKACPYDGYLVTETDSKPLVESNKLLAETIGKVMVHCLYNKSGCQWQGTLSACITHGTTCAYGNSPVVCNRCGSQIVHRQVQEHAQLCPGVQSQTQQADGSQAQLSTATAQTVTKDPSLASSAGSAAVAATMVPSATTAVTPSSVATGGSAGATTIAAPPSSAGASASAPQTATTEQWYQQQMQYSQYYQQQYAGYNPYTQQYQQYGQYQQAYQQYTLPQLQVASQNVVQASVQPGQVLQSSQPQQTMHQPQLQAPTHPQTQQHQVQSQPQSQPNLPHLQAPAGQTQPMQSAYQVPPMQQQSQVPLQLPAPQAQPTVHQPASTQVGNQQFGVPSTQATQHQVQPPVQAQPAQLQALPPQQNQNLQPHMQLNSQIQHHSMQVQLQSYQQSQAYPQPMPLMHPPNTSYPQQQMPPSAPQHPAHASHQQGLVSQHPAPMRPPTPSQQPAMLPPQGILHTPQHQQNAGYHAQRPPMHSSNPSQAPQQGLPPHSSVSSQAVQPQKNNFGSGSKDGQSVVALDSSDTSIGKDGIAGQAGNCQGPGVQGGKEHNASDTYDNLEKGGSAHQASQRSARPPGSFAPPGMGPQHPFGPDRIFPQHMMNSSAMPYTMQGQPNQTSRPPKHSHGDNIRPPLEQPYGSFNSGTAQRTFVDNHIPSPMPQPAGIRPGEGMVRPPIVGPFPGHHDTMPPFVPEPLGRPHPPGMSKSNGVGGGPFVSGRAFHEEGFNASGEHLRPFAAYPGRHNVHHKDIEDLKQFPGRAHLDVHGLQMGPNSFERTLGRPDGFPERPAFENQKGQFPIALHDDFSRKPNATGRPDFLSPGAEFDHHGSDEMPNLRNRGPVFQGMSAGPAGVHKDYLGPVNAFDGPVFPHTRFHPGHMHPDDPNLVADYSRHGFPKGPGHFGLTGVMRNAGWCRICLFNCGSAENLDLHVETREHQQCSMDLILKMKQDVAKRQKLNLGGPKSFHNKKVAGKVHFRGNRR